MDKGETGDLLSSIIDQRIKNLFKSFLSEVESIKLDHSVMLSKVEAKTNPEFAKNIDYLSDKKFEGVRKKILDSGNDCIREVESLLSCFDCSFNQEKFENVHKRNKIIKRIFAPIIYEK